MSYSVFLSLSDFLHTVSLGPSMLLQMALLCMEKINIHGFLLHGFLLAQPRRNEKKSLVCCIVLQFQFKNKHKCATKDF